MAIKLPKYFNLLVFQHLYQKAQLENILVGREFQLYCQYIELKVLRM